MSRDQETKEAAAVPPSDDDGRELDQQIAQYLKLGLPVGTLVAAVAAGVLQGAPAVVLVLTTGALVSVIALFWASVRTLVGETPLSGADAYALGAPRAEEEKKRAVLRALKDLEFERSVGKISDEDYHALVAKYRDEGKRLIRALDEDAEPRRQKVEGLVAERLFREGLAESPPEPYRGTADPAVKAAKKNKKKKGKPARVDDAKPAENEAASKSECASCGTKNDADAAFCKKCGARMGAADDGEPEPEAGEQRAQEKTS
jgi:hypothetical protein